MENLFQLSPFLILSVNTEEHISVVFLAYERIESRFK